MKIQINNLAVLERLIGGDTELEVEVRNNIVQDFTKKHLKALANDDNFNRAIEGVRAEVTEAAMQKVATATSPHSWNRAWKLNPPLKAEIEREAKIAVQDAHTIAIRDAVAALKERYTDEFVQATIDKHLKDTIDAQVKAGVAKRLREISEGLAKA